MRTTLAAALTAISLLTSTLGLTTAAMSDITTDTVRQKAEQACYDDVNRMCGDAIPDEDKIKTCMKAHHAQLSPKCRAIYDSYMK